MSGNNAYVKSMNGIVSFDSGGTTIEGGNITSGEIDATTINTTDLIATGSVNTSYIFVDYMDKNINDYITFISDVLLDYKLYVSNLWPSTGTNIIVNGFLNIINGLKTPTIEGIDTNSLTKQLKIGQDNDYTTSINIGRAEQTILGTVYPAIPPRTTFYAVGDDDIANKKYVDTVTGGSSILNSTNIWTGTSNTFNNIIYTSQIDSVTPSIAYNFLTNNTAGINIGTSSSVITLGSSVTPVRCPYVPLITTDICNKLYVDSVSSSAGSSLLSLTNTWTGTSNTFNNTVNLGSYYRFSGINIEGLVDAGQTYGILNNTATCHIRIGHSITSGNVEIANNKTSGEINIMNNASSSGNINIGDNLNGAINLVRNSTTGGNVNIANTFKIYRSNFEYFNTLGTSFNFLNNLLSTTTMNFGGNATLYIGSTGTIVLAGNKTSGYVAIGSPSGGCSTITNGQLLCHKEIVLDNSTATTIYANSLTGSMTIRSDNTMNCIGSGTSLFGSWNNGNVGLGTQSFSNITIGAGGTGTNLRTTTINGTLIVAGSGNPSHKLYGLTEYENKTTNYTIPLTINKEYFLVIGGGSPLVITWPANATTGQIINIRNTSVTTTHQQTTFPSTTVGFYPTQAGSAYFQPAWSMPASSSQRFYFDGANWIGF